MKSPFVKGIYDGIPIALGYLPVSFGFGILAIRSGLSVLAAISISVTNLTSAGQVAGVAVIAAGGSYLEMALTQLVINIRYALMGISLSQKLDSSFRTPQRLLTAYGITDEIFAVASAQPGLISAAYLAGMIVIAFFGWTLGTVLGAAAGQILPELITNAMGIVLYAMFLAIVLPAAKKSKGILLAALLAAGCSVLFRYGFPAVSSGFAVISGSAAVSRSGRTGGECHVSIVIYIAVMAVVTYLIRMLPLTIFRKKIRSPFLRSFLYYIPYTVLSAMTIPAIFYSTGSLLSAVIGTAIAVILAYRNLPLIVVALAASASALVTDFLCSII